MILRFLDLASNYGCCCKVVGDKVVSETQSSMGHHISVASSGKKSRQSQRATSEVPVELKQGGEWPKYSKSNCYCRVIARSV